MYLMETLDVQFSSLVNHLYMDHVVTSYEADDITAEKSSWTMNEKLLDVLSRKSAEDFKLFLDALQRCGQQHVRKVITDRQGLLINA